METLQWLLGEIAALESSVSGSAILYGALCGAAGLLAGILLALAGRKWRWFERPRPAWNTLARLYYGYFPLLFLLFGGVFGGIFGAHTAADEFINNNAKQLGQYGQEYFAHFQAKIPELPVDEYRGMGLEEIVAAEMGKEYGVVPGTRSHEVVSAASASVVLHVLNWAEIPIKRRGGLEILNDLGKVRTRPATFIGQRSSMHRYVDARFGGAYSSAFWWFFPFLLLPVVEFGVHGLFRRPSSAVDAPTVRPLTKTIYTPATAMTNNPHRTESTPVEPVQEESNWYTPPAADPAPANPWSLAETPATMPAPPAFPDNPAPTTEFTNPWSVAETTPAPPVFMENPTPNPESPNPHDTPETPATNTPPPVFPENPTPTTEFTTPWSVAETTPAPPVFMENPTPNPEAANPHDTPETPATNTPPPVFPENPAPAPEFTNPWSTAETPVTNTPPPAFPEIPTPTTESTDPWGASATPAFPPPPPVEMKASPPPPPPDDSPASRPKITLPPSVSGAPAAARPQTGYNPPGPQHFTPSRQPTPFAVTYILGGALLQLYSSGLGDGWSAEFVAIFGFVVYYVGLGRLQFGVDVAGQSAVGMLKVAALIGVGAAVIDLIPILGGIFASLGYAAAFLTQMIGFLKLQGSQSLNPAGKSGVTLLILAMILSIVVSFVQILPFGDYLAAPLAMIALALVFFGWVKVQEGLIVE